jgi:hypothetical protein
MRRPLKRIFATLLFFGLAPAATPNGVHPIPVAVFAPPDVTDSLVRRIFVEADAIWAPAGISLDWRRVTANAAERWRLDVTIDDTQHDDQEWRAALGWITFRGDSVQTSIHLSRASVERLFLRTAGHTQTLLQTHEVLLGRALGRALSHELGHYLLQSKGHTTRGLMRATWPSDEFFAMNRSGFELSAHERDAATQAP